MYDDNEFEEEFNSNEINNFDKIEITSEKPILKSNIKEDSEHLNKNNLKGISITTKENIDKNENIEENINVQNDKEINYENVLIDSNRNTSLQDNFKNFMKMRKVKNIYNINRISANQKKLTSQKG